MQIIETFPSPNNNTTSRNKMEVDGDTPIKGSSPHSTDVMIARALHQFGKDVTESIGNQICLSGGLREDIAKDCFSLFAIANVVVKKGDAPGLVAPVSVPRHIARKQRMNKYVPG